MKEAPVASAGALKAALPAVAIVPHPVGSAHLRTDASMPVHVARRETFVAFIFIERTIPGLSPAWPPDVECQIAPRFSL